EIVLGINFCPQLIAAAEPFPRQELTEPGAEWHRGEEGESGILAGVVAGRGPARLDRTLGDGVEALERRDQGAGLVGIHLEFAAGHALDVLGKAHAGRTEMRERATERTLHLPAHALLGVRRGKYECKGQGG